jgi:very-short-patch-repair endonuclease
MVGMPEARAITPGNRRRSHLVRTIAAKREGVYSVVAPELLGADARLIAALIAAGSGAYLSHGTAAWRWQLTPAPPTVIELGVPHRRAGARGIALHRSGVLRPGDVVWNGRFRSTSVTRTLLDLGVRYEQPALLRALAEAEFGHDVRPDDIGRVLRRGHPGSARLRAALDAHAPGHGTAKSRLERRFRALLVRQGVELPERNQPLGPWVVDCIWRDRRVVVELDGRQHARPHQADSDDDRDLWLRRNRYLPRRYGAKQVDQQPDAVIADLLDAFAESIKLGYVAADQSPPPQP